MFALVFNSKVVQVEVDQFPVHPSLQWVDIDSIVPTPEVGWGFDGSVFIMPPPSSPPSSDKELAELGIRGNKALLAFGRVLFADDALTEDELVALIRSKLP